MQGHHKRKHGACALPACNGQQPDNAGGVTNLLGQTVNDLGQTVLTFVDQTGNLVQRTVGGNGTIVGQSNLGSILSLPTISETTNAAGQTVRRVQAQGGGVIEAVLDQAGNVLSMRIVNQIGNGR